MAKTTKKSGKPARSDAKSAESQLADVRATIALGLDGIREEIEGLVDETIKPQPPHDRASRIAWLTKQAAQIGGELRKMDKAELKAVEDLSPALVLAYMRTLEQGDRARLVREIQALDRAGGLLS